MTVDVPAASGPHPGLLDWLASHRVDYELHEHPETFTARETARAERIDPRTFAKTVGVVTDDGRRALLVLDATDHLDLVKARKVLGAGRVHLLTEPELLELCPGCDVGAMPPVGELFGVSVHADFAVREDPQITFHAGSHRFSVRLDRRAWEEAGRVVYGDLAADSEEPAWSRS
ncbi:MAG TPA: YbaK/EbsC family protein [Candidatus Limnocylindrales bacterium]